MTISGFSFIRNGVKLRYPFIESIKSILPICDEFVIAVGNSDDETRSAVLEIGSPKIKIIDTVWNDALRDGGKILAQQTDIAFNQISGDWGFYLQGDEVVHENDLEKIEEACRSYYQNQSVDGLLFSWLHFFGNYNFCAKPFSRGVYPYEVRIIRNNKLIKSFRDAQGFRKFSNENEITSGGSPRRVHAKKINATIYHYGKVRGPEDELIRAKSFHTLWHNDEWIKTNLHDKSEYDYTCDFPLIKFNGNHPGVMMDRIKRGNWNFNPDKKNIRIPYKYKILNALESLTGLRPFEFKNYTLH